jgi:hypothetical protein
LQIASGLPIKKGIKITMEIKPYEDKYGVQMIFDNGIRCNHMIVLSKNTE